ncbi:TPA: glycosyltransferase [Candidatus Poribacteria bacterium]|nr:glycosyltransferase [Candidatus Poribacteria bacterium]
MSVKVTIGLCVKDAAKVVRTAFRSISIQDYPRELLKLVIVDDGSSDETLSLVTKFAKQINIKTFVASTGGKGLGAARQIVINNAEGDYLVWVDDDLVLSKDFIRNAVEFMERNPTVGAAQGALVPIRRKTIIGIIDYGVIVNPNLRKPKRIGAGGSIFRLKALKNVGGFDVRIKGAGEDLDVSRRLIRSGWELAIISTARFYPKYQPATLKALFKKHFWYGYGNHFLYHKYKEQWLLNEYFPPITLLLGLRGSYLIWRTTKKKKGLFFVILHFVATLSRYVGFIRSHLNAYGHVNGI